MIKKTTYPLDICVECLERRRDEEWREKDMRKYADVFGCIPVAAVMVFEEYGDELSAMEFMVETAMYALVVWFIFTLGKTLYNIVYENLYRGIKKPWGRGVCNIILAALWIVISVVLIIAITS